MAWIESHQSLGTHRKLLALCQALHIDDTRAVGMLHYLWWWALDNAPDGDLTGIPAETIALASHYNPPINLPKINKKGRPNAGKMRENAEKIQDKYKENANKYLEILHAVGFLDNYHLHNWQDYTGKLVSARERNRERQRNFRKRQSNANVTVTSPLRNGATVPNRTQHNPTVQYITTTPPPPPPDGKSSLSSSEKQEETEKDVFKIYEEELGRITEAVRNTLVDAVEHFTEDWVRDAIKEAVLQGQRKWSYVEGILRNWEAEGRDAGKSERVDSKYSHDYSNQDYNERTTRALESSAGRTIEDIHTEIKAGQSP